MIVGDRPYVGLQRGLRKSWLAHESYIVSAQAEDERCPVLFWRYFNKTLQNE